MSDPLGWLARRDPAPPQPLAERVRQALADSPAAEPEPVAEALAVAGVDLLARILEAPECRALDLLAADALVTYAFEAAAEAPEHLEEFAAATISRLAALGEDGAR